MVTGRVLVIGLDPTRLDGWDPEPVLAALALGQARFDELGIDADMCLVAPDDDPEGAIAFNTTPVDTADAALRWLGQSDRPGTTKPLS